MQIPKQLVLVRVKRDDEWIDISTIHDVDHGVYETMLFRGPTSKGEELYRGPSLTSALVASSMATIKEAHEPEWIVKQQRFTLDAEQSRAATARGGRNSR